MISLVFGLKDYSKQFGVVDKFECNSCLQQNHMHLFELNSFFTLFFIPLIPIGSDYFLICGTCHKKIVLTKLEFQTYKRKSDIELSYTNQKISLFERDCQLAEINLIIEEQKKIKKENAEIESAQWIEMVSTKSDDELMYIHFQDRDKYIQSMHVAVKEELKRRRLI
jgi:hypothetical protein